MNKILVITIGLLWAINTCALSQNAAPPAAGKPFVLGVTEEIMSKQLSEKRTLNIYLPAGYKEGDTTRYPVIYLLDGSADEDFIPVAGLVHFNSYPWVGRLPLSIVVGIANIDRKRDFTFPSALPEDKKLLPTAGQSARFIAFIEQELQPYIDKKYKTGTSKTIIGESLGGLLATEILLKKPSLFSQYIIISPSLWWNDGSLLALPADSTVFAALQPTKVYIGVGKEGLAPGRTPHVMEVDANLLAEKLRKLPGASVTVFFDYQPTENHATIAHQALLNAFKMLH